MLNTKPVAAYNGQYIYFYLFIKQQKNKNLCKYLHLKIDSSKCLHQTRVSLNYEFREICEHLPLYLYGELKNLKQKDPLTTGPLL